MKYKYVFQFCLIMKVSSYNVKKNIVKIKNKGRLKNRNIKIKNKKYSPNKVVVKTVKSPNKVQNNQELNK